MSGNGTAPTGSSPSELLATCLSRLDFCVTEKQVFYELDPDKTESISFEGSKEKLVSMGAPDVFIQMVLKH